MASTAIQKIGNKNSLRALILDMKDSLADVLPRHITPERVLKMALVAASRQPKLYECTRESIAKGVMDSASLGLDCSGLLGSGYLVPYWNGKIRMLEAQFIPGYRGLIDLARRSGQVSRIEAHLVHENDDCEIEFGTDPKLIHKPSFKADRGGVLGAYMVAEIVGGGKQVEFMPIADLLKIKERSKSRDKAGNLIGPWVTDEGEMMRKTVVRRGVKYLPLSPERANDLARAIELDNASYVDIEDIATGEPKTPEDRAAELREKKKTRPTAGGDDPGEDSGEPPADSPRQGTLLEE